MCETIRQKKAFFASLGDHSIWERSSKFENKYSDFRECQMYKIKSNRWRDGKMMVTCNFLESQGNFFEN